MPENMLPKAQFHELRGEKLTLQLIAFYPESGPQLPFYWYDILLNETGQRVGKISIRIGYNTHVRYNGHIGYEIDEPYRGHHYARTACRMVLPVASAYGMTHLILTCDADNAPSRRIIEGLGARLEAIVSPPRDFFAWREDMGPYRIYRLDLMPDCRESRCL